MNPFCILETKNQDPFRNLRGLLETYRISSSYGQIPFMAGAVGYLSYDLGFLLEKKLKKKIPDDLRIPDCWFGFYNTVVITDNIKKILYVSCVGFPEKSAHLGKLLCKRNLKNIQRLLSRCNNKARQKKDTNKAPAELKSNFTYKDYLAAVTKAKEYIKSGDIYQVNLSQRFQARTSLEAFNIYRRLRTLSPSYFSAYLDAGDLQILSSSPERFLRLEKNIVTTMPMKGTRPRGETQKQDILLKNELLNSQKDKAELTMIVDLERNDLGRVCNYDSIKVAKLRQVEKYNTVFQTTASICGRLHRDKDRVDLLRACFPGGSITGCPKIRSMEIIEELEPTRRSIYTGALGYLDFGGDMDFNILIRTILKKQDWLYFSAGGGIVADSKPEEEYNETLVKAKAMMEAVGA